MENTMDKLRRKNSFCTFERTNQNLVKVEYVKDLARLAVNNLDTFYLLEILIDLEQRKLSGITRFGYINDDDCNCFVNENRFETEIEDKVIDSMFSREMFQDDKMDILKKEIKALEKDFKLIQNKLYKLLFVQPIFTVRSHGTTTARRSKSRPRLDISTSNLKKSNSFLSMWSLKM